jgi:hypothetical protein
MTQTINIEFIVMMLKNISTDHSTETIKIAKGKYSLPKNKFKAVVKKIINT